MSRRPTASTVAGVFVMTGTTGEMGTTSRYVALSSSESPRHASPSFLPTAPKPKVGFSSTILGLVILQKFMQGARGGAPSSGCCSFSFSFFIFRLLHLNQLLT